VSARLRLGGGGVDAEQPAAVPLAEQQGEQRPGEAHERGAALGPDVLGEPRDVPCVTVTVQYVSKLGEAHGLGDDQPVQPDQLVGVNAEHDARPQLLEGVVVAGGIEGDGDGQVLHHRREQRVLIAEVGVDCALRHLGGGGELIERGSPEARFQENPQRRGENLAFPRASLGRRGPASLALGSYL
jgi:hypothetical protein